MLFRSHIDILCSRRSDVVRGQGNSPIRGYCTVALKAETAVERTIPVDRITKIHRAKVLTKFLCERVIHGLNQRLTQLKSGDKNEIIGIAAAIMHIFAHGHLTAHPGGVDAKSMCILNLELAQVMLDFMDREFSKRVESTSIIVPH